MNVYSAAILISIIVYIAVGTYAGRKVKNVESYIVVGRQAPTLFIVGTLVASYLSTATFLGETGFAYGANAGGWILWPAISVTGYIYGAVFFGRYLRRSRSLTVAEYFGRRFDSRKVQLVAGLTVVVGIGCYLIAVTQGSAIVLSKLTELSYTQSIFVVWISYTSFTMYSGSRGVVITDTLMFLLFTTVSVLALYTILDAHGGWLAALDELVKLDTKEGLTSWHGVLGPGQEWQTPADFLIWLITIAIAWSLVTAISPWQTSRYLMAKNEHVVMRSACFAAISVVAIQILLFAAAATINLTKSDIEPHQEAMIWAAMNLMPPLLGAIVLAGIVAAALSSATTFLSLVGFNVSNDIVQRSKEDDASALRFSRRTMFLVSFIALVVSLISEPQIFWLTYFAGTLFASAWGPVAIMSVWSKRITADAAFWGITIGFFGNVIPKILSSSGMIDLPSYLDPILIGAAASLFTVLWASRRTTVSENEHEFRSALHTTPTEDISDRETRKTLGIAYATGLFGVVLTPLMFVFYVMPYQAATVGASISAGFDWFSVESIFAFGWTVMFLACAWLMYWGVSRSYDPGRRPD